MRKFLGLSLLLLTVTLAQPNTPVWAHGATTTPVSRSAECGTEGGAAAQSAPCRDAEALAGSVLPDQWDNLRVPDVNERERDVIPDGQLCSAGMPGFRGLDQLRSDWPVTTLVPGAGITLRYRATIPHAGSFLFYITRNEYDPTQPLTWANIEEKPFIVATDPPIVDGSYVVNATVPNKTGRHLIYVIWRNSESTDTYYSCSDVLLARQSGQTGTVTSNSPSTTLRTAATRNASGGKLLAAGAIVLVIVALVVTTARRKKRRW